MSILSQDITESKLTGTIRALNIKLTILPLPGIGSEVWADCMPAGIVNDREKIQRGLNAPTTKLTQYIKMWLECEKIEVFEEPQTLIRSLFPNLVYAGYINKHFVYINHENKPCLIIGIV